MLKTIDWEGRAAYGGAQERIAKRYGLGSGRGGSYAIPDGRLGQYDCADGVHPSDVSYART